MRRRWAVYGADVRDVDAITGAGRACIAAQGVPDVVIANAGISVGMDTAVRADLEVMRATFETNNLGLAATFHPFVAPMTASDAAARWSASPASPASAACPATAPTASSKAAVIAYCESLRGELRASGVRVVTIAPGYIDTPLTQGNRYSMPFLMSADAFADRAFAAIGAGDQLPRHSLADGDRREACCVAAERAVRPRSSRAGRARSGRPDSLNAGTRQKRRCAFAAPPFDASAADAAGFARLSSRRGCRRHRHPSGHRRRRRSRRHHRRAATAAAAVAAATTAVAATAAAASGHRRRSRRRRVPPPPPKPPRLPPPPKPPGRSSRGRASLTTIARPSRAWPFMPLMAACASGSEPISTKPKPFERPVSRSIMTLADDTVPYCANACWRSSSRTLYERLPTYSLLPMGEMPSLFFTEMWSFYPS